MRATTCGEGRGGARWARDALYRALCRYCANLPLSTHKGRVLGNKIVSAIVAGTGFLTASGSSRADNIRSHCRDGMVVALAREPDNAHDANAVAVSITSGSWLFGQRAYEIGYLKAPLAARLAPIMDAGTKVTGKVVSHYAPRDMDFPRVSVELTYSQPPKLKKSK